MLRELFLMNPHLIVGLMKPRRVECSEVEFHQDAESTDPAGWFEILPAQAYKLIKTDL